MERSNKPVFDFTAFSLDIREQKLVLDMPEWIPYINGELDGIKKLSRHHIIPDNQLKHIKDYGCAQDPTSPFCATLLKDGVQELCGFNKLVSKVEVENVKFSDDYEPLLGKRIKRDDLVDEECKDNEEIDVILEPSKKVEPSKKSASVKHPPFVWETGNLFYGPEQHYRTDDTKCKLDTNVLRLMDCLFAANQSGTSLARAYEALTEYNKSIAGQKCSSKSEKENCIKAAGELNAFYRGYCSVKDNPLYESNFYLKHFWEQFEVTTKKAKFRLKKDFDCNAIRLDAQNARTEVLRQESTMFLQKDAVVSDHFHKTKAFDSSDSRF